MNLRNRNRRNELQVKKREQGKLTPAETRRLKELNGEFSLSLSDNQTDDDRFLNRFVKEYGAPRVTLSETNIEKSGSCNFCASHPRAKVYEASGSGVKVRFCNECFKGMVKQWIQLGGRGSR
jgi:hypothetical protein